MAQITEYDFAKSYIESVILAREEIINGKVAGSESPYLHNTKFNRVFSPDGSWVNFMRNNIYAMADFVALDSPLPLKKRPTLIREKGNVEKIGTRRVTNESDEKRIHNLLLSGSGVAVDEARRMLAEKALACQSGLYESLESVVYQALSNEGYAVYAPATNAADAAAGAKDNVGIGFRVNFGFDTSNTFNITVPWSDAANATPISDFTKVVDAARAKGKRIIEANTNLATMNRLLETADVKKNVASMQSVIVISDSAVNYRRPTVEELNAFMLSRFGFVFTVRDHSFVQERDGVQQIVDMWNDGAVAFVTSNMWGSLVWTECVEMFKPIAGHTYLKTGDQLALISMYRDKTESTSFVEITEGQTMSLPVIDANIVAATLDTINPAA
jgi:hypothetical protein